MASTAHTKRILIAEDSPTQAEKLKYILEGHGYDATMAGNGVQALALLAEDKPDLVISDIVMPEMDGYELCRRIRSDNNTHDLPVVLLTALTDTQDVLEGLSCGADSFITKPYSEDYLLVQISRLLADEPRSEGTDSPVNIDIVWAGKKCTIVTDQKRTFNLLISTYEAAVRRNMELSRTQDELRTLNDRLEDLVAERTAELSSEIATRKHRELELRSAALYTRSLIEASLDPLVTINVDGKITDVNSATELIAGVSREHLIGNDFSDYFTEPEKARASYQKVFAEGHVHDFPLIIRHASGRTTEVLYNASVYKNESGDVQGVLAAARDVTELKKSQELIRNILESVDQGFIILDRDFRIQMANRAYCEQVNVPADAVIGRYCYAISHKAAAPCDGIQHDCPVNKAFATGQIQESVHTHGGEAGESRIVQVKAYPFQRDEAGRITSVIETQIDITEKQKLEELLHHALKLEAIGRLAGGVAHDFNNLTAIVLGYGEMLLDGLSPENPLRKYAEQIVEAGSRSAALTRQLLAFSRKQTLQPEVLDLNALLRNLEKMLNRLIRADIELGFSLAGDLSCVTADPGQIEQIVTNLALNARDAMPLGGRLTIETRDVELDQMYAMSHESITPGKYVMLALTDTGCGMDKATMARLFEPFFTTKPKGKGTGLGLATAYGIVKQSGGHIWAYSEPGKGTTFKIYLPRTDARPKARAIEVEGEAPRGNGERILLVEDEASLRELCATVLVRFGYQVSSAANGLDALRLVREHGFEPDLVLSDVIMPGMNGAEMADRLRQDRPGLKVLFMSGHPDETIAPHGVLDPAKPFIQKPFTERALAVKVREMLGGNTTVSRQCRRVLMIDDDEQFRELVRHHCTKRGHVFAGVDCAAAALEMLAGQAFDVLLVDLHIPGTDGGHVLQQIRAAGCTTPAIVLTGDVASAEMGELRPLGVVRALEKSSDGEPLLLAIEAVGLQQSPREVRHENE